MGVISFNETRHGRQSTETETETRLTRNFVVVVDSPQTTPTQIRAHGNAPRIGQSHPENGLAKCTRVDPQLRDEGVLIWDCMVEYVANKSASPPQGGDPRSADVTRPKVRAYSMARGKEITTDVHGNPFIASNRIDSLGSLTIDDSIMRFEFSGLVTLPRYILAVKDFASRLPRGTDGLGNKLNKTRMFGFEKHKLKLSAISGTTQEVTINGQTVRKMEAMIAIDLSSTWDAQLVDQGRYRLNKETNFHFNIIESADPYNDRIDLSVLNVDYDESVEPITDAFGEIYSDTVLLNGKGVPLGKNQTPVKMNIETYFVAELKGIFKTLQFPLAFEDYEVV